jgi:hypothetical protein
MNTIIIVSYMAVILLLAAGTLAEPSMKLDGSAGKAILDSMTSKIENQTKISQSINQTDSENGSLGQAKVQDGGLWSWGGIPDGYTLNESSGELVPVPTGEADWLPGSS